MRTGDRKTRRPDVHMVCDPPDATTDETGDVQLIVEVISQSNKGLAWQRKLEPYKARADLKYLMLIEQNPYDVLLVTQLAQGWDSTVSPADDDVILPPRISCQLSMADIYERIA